MFFSQNQSQEVLLEQQMTLLETQTWPRLMMCKMKNIKATLRSFTDTGFYPHPNFYQLPTCLIQKMDGLNSSSAAHSSYRSRLTNIPRDKDFQLFSFSIESEMLFSES